MNAVTAAIFGLIFGAGLVISGMTDPNRILAFLDVAGDWDPSLALVMAGAIAIALPAYALARRTQTTVLGEALHLPDRRRPYYTASCRRRGSLWRGMGAERLMSRPSHRPTQHGPVESHFVFRLGCRRHLDRDVDFGEEAEVVRGAGEKTGGAPSASNQELVVSSNGA